MKIGDLIVYPSKIDKQIHIGEITGNFEYQPNIEPGYPQTRSVKWLKHLPRTVFSQGALWETGSAMSFFQIKNFADEFMAVLEGKKSIGVAPNDESAGIEPLDIEQQTRDFVIKQLSQNLKGLPFEEFVAHLLEKMGYRARLTQTNEPSVDIIAHKDDLDFEPPIIKVQVKSSDGISSDKDVSALYGKVGASEHGLFVTLGTFSSQATRFAGSKSNLRLIDGQELVDLIFTHYEQFDSKYKSILPLKRIYVPEDTTSPEE